MINDSLDSDHIREKLKDILTDIRKAKTRKRKETMMSVELVTLWHDALESLMTIDPRLDASYRTFLEDEDYWSGDPIFRYNRPPGWQRIGNA